MSELQAKQGTRGNRNPGLMRGESCPYFEKGKYPKAMTGHPHSCRSEKAHFKNSAGFIEVGCFSSPPSQ